MLDSAETPALQCTRVEAHRTVRKNSCVAFRCDAFVLFASLARKRFRRATNSAAKNLQRVMAGHIASLGG